MTSRQLYVSRSESSRGYSRFGIVFSLRRGFRPGKPLSSMLPPFPDCPMRNIGSATMSGRIAAVAAVNENGRLTVFVGAASGGVWKSVNGGTTFKPVFDRQSVQSIGAVTIDPSNSKIVWVGTGEAWTRNSVSIGDGIYKSTDGGENWTNMGLKDSEHIAKILVDPKDSNTVLACATGHLWNDNDERGVYKTTDGGKTWKKVLAGANGSTGCGMLATSPLAPKTIFASMWDFRRQGWTFRSGGPGSGLYQSTDGGDHWTELNDSNSKGLCPRSPGDELRWRWRLPNRKWSTP